MPLQLTAVVQGLELRAAHRQSAPTSPATKSPSGPGRCGGGRRDAVSTYMPGPSKTIRNGATASAKQSVSALSLSSTAARPTTPRN